MIEQGVGQLSIQWSAKKNQKILDDPNIDQKIKDKIIIIQKAKAFFEDYYQIQFDDIYEKTTFLDREAVSYMVTASPKDKIKPHRVSFPIVGEFPYLAFFKKKSALKFAKRLEEKGLVTWMRPVHAYSSLNYFDDRILSSFFVFDEYELAELVFHELTHLMVFIKNNVGFNESLAQFFAHYTLREYYKGRADKFLESKKASRELYADIVPMIQGLNQEYKKVATFILQEQTRKRVLKSQVFPRFEKYCERTHRKCQLKVENWNNARMVGYLNYEQTYEKIENVFKNKRQTIKEFARFMIEAQDNFENLKEKPENFLIFLESL